MSMQPHGLRVTQKGWNMWPIGASKNNIVYNQQLLLDTGYCKESGLGEHCTDNTGYCKESGLGEHCTDNSICHWPLEIQFLYSVTQIYICVWLPLLPVSTVFTEQCLCLSLVTWHHLPYQ
jgi:hypothetical protein